VSTAADIRDALRGVFPSPEWLLGFEIRNAAGFSANRAIDAQAVNTWPSRGLEIVAVEIKVSRSDFQRELASPQKIEEGTACADRVAIAAPKGMVKPAELPKGWGLIEVADGKGRWKERGERKPARPVDRHFLVAMMKAVGGDAEAAFKHSLRKADAEREAAYQKRIDREVERRMKAVEQIARQRQPIDDWLKECGFEEWSGNDAIKAAVKIAHKAHLGGHDYGNSLPALHRQIVRISETLGEALRDVGAIES
jgi:hypothetical protein